MIHLVRLFFITSFLCILQGPICAETTEKPSLKVLLLIIATDDKPAYIAFQKIWESYMNTDPTHIEAYFLRANPNIPTNAEVNPNEITLKTTEGFAPGIINKTLMALEALQSRLNEFDFVIRTNISSFFVFPRLLAYLQTLPKTNCYRGVALYPTGLGQEFMQIPFASGTGIIMSKDLAIMLANEHKEYDRYKAEMPDDVFIGLFFQKRGVPVFQAPRSDYPSLEAWMRDKGHLSENAFHFRAKSHHLLRGDQEPYEEELFILKALLNQFYQTTPTPIVQEKR